MKLFDRSLRLVTSVYFYYSTTLLLFYSSLTPPSRVWTLLLLLLPVLSGHFMMDQLETFGVNPGLPRTEFIQLLTSHPTMHLKSLRACLFEDASKSALIPTEFQGLPLVNRRDTALRPVAKVLSEDIWSIVTCITTKTNIPRTLLRNGKKSSHFLKEAPRPSQAVSLSSSSNISTLNNSLSSTSITASCLQSQPSISQPVRVCKNEQTLEHSHVQLPSSSYFSNTLISREITSLKEEVRAIKANLASVCNKPPAYFPPSVELQFGHMLKDIRDEMHHLHDRLNKVLVDPQVDPQVPAPHIQTPSSPMSVTNDNPNLTISTWNCRGLYNAHPYLHQLAMEGSDVIAINEHWLWPYQLNSLCDIHPDYLGYGVSEGRLNEESTLTRGCGGVGVIWRRSLKVSPLTSIQSDRICAICITLSESSCVNVICAYLPSTDHSNDEFCEYLSDLASLISALEASGPIIVLGDLNAHLNDESPSNTRGNLLLDVISSCDLCVASTSSISTGPGYTYFSGINRTTVDYILTNTCISHSITKCYIHNHQELNLSDHLPLSVVLSVGQLSETTTTECSKINWKKALQNNDLIRLYSQEVSTAVRPLLSSTFQSVDVLNNEIITVCNILSSAASKHLPSIRPRKMNPYIHDHELRLLCKRSRRAWEKWKSAGRPSEGQFYQEKRDTKKAVRQFLTSRRAWAEIV